MTKIKLALGVLVLVGSSMAQADSCGFPDGTTYDSSCFGKVLDLAQRAEVSNDTQIASVDCTCAVAGYADCLEDRVTSCGISNPSCFMPSEDYCDSIYKRAH